MKDTQSPTLWFDKDGVLAKYNWEFYENNLDDTVLWRVKNAHVFKYVKPYKNMVEAFKVLYHENVNINPIHREMSLKVLTSVCNGITLSEHVLDGYRWCKKYLGLKERDFFACSVPKPSIPISMFGRITERDFLFDDYMPNLQVWKESGGTPVKVLNGLNSPVTTMSQIDVNDNPDAIITNIRNIVL